MILPAGWLTLTAALALAYGQTTVPKEKIPAGIPVEVRAEIERLYLKTTDVVEAASKLGALGPRAAPAVPFLMGLLKGGSSLECVEKDGTRFCGFGLEQGAAAEALARIGAPALEPLLAALAKGDEEEVSGAIQALARMNDPRAATALIQRVKDPRYPHRKLIPPELGHSEAPRARDLLVSLARDDDPAVRSGALRGIAASNDPRAGGLLIAGLSDAEAAVREAAAFSLARSPAPEAFDALGKALADPSATVRNGACQALGALKDARATESLVAVVAGDPDKLVRFQAGRALEAVTGQQFGEDGAAWQRWYEKTKQPK